MTIWRRLWRLIAPRPIMCPKCGDAVACVNTFCVKGLYEIKPQCQSETCGEWWWE